MLMGEGGGRGLIIDIREGGRGGGKQKKESPEVGISGLCTTTIVQTLSLT